METEKKFLIALRDLPPEGREYSVTDPAVWSRNIEAFHMDCRLSSDPELDITILPMNDGWVLRGSIRADVVVPCSRCCKDTDISISENFDDYVQMPDEGEEVPERTFEEGDDHLVFEHGALLLDLASIAWEQFALALPSTPLCRPDCKGLCQHCGKDLNEGPCGCDDTGGDPRLAVLRGLKITKN